MNKRIALTAAGLAGALVMGGGAALASTTGPVSGGVITGCYTNAEVNGSHALVLQDGGSTCPKGTSAVNWYEQGAAGPAGPAGPTGPAGPAGPQGSQGATGPQGPAGPTGPAGPAGATGSQGLPGTNGNTILSGTGPPGNLGNAGDFYIDTSADVLYGPMTTNGWPATGTSLIGQAGPQGSQGPAGPQGPAGATGPQGPAGSGAALACTTDGGAAGTVQTNLAVGSDNSVTFTSTCVALTTDANCTHSDGVGDTYTDCNDLLGTAGDASTYNATMAQDAITAFEVNPIPAGAEAVISAAGLTVCGDAYTDLVDFPGHQGLADTVVEFVAWIYTGADAGNVYVVTGGTSLTCGSPSSSWN
jgi:Collagen triple helix repeat (20 copies)